jgi:hypothetical protein
MKDIKNPLKWHNMDEAAAKRLTIVTDSPNVVFQMALDNAPYNLQEMPGAVSYFISGYITPKTMQNGVTIGGEIVIVRTEEEMAKAYNFVIATSSDGKVYYNGPYKDFPDHHFNVLLPVPIESLFGHTPFTKSEKS